MRMLVKLFAVFAIALACYPMAGSELTTAPTTSRYTLTALSPTQAVAGSGELVLTLTGTSFKRSAQVMFGSTHLPTTYVDNKTLRATVPINEVTTAGTVSVKVVNLDTKGGTTNALTFYVVNSVPAISTITPSSLTVSGLPKKVTILGSGFVDGVKVNVGTEAQGITQVDPLSVLPEAIGVEIPADYLENPGSVPISVTNPSMEGGQSNVVMLMVRGKAYADWQTVANNTLAIPGGNGRTFNSYNQPSVNQSGLVVFKGQSKGQSGPTVGIYVRNMSGVPQDITRITDNTTAVPQPNNTYYKNDSQLSTFIQFPSFPRIDVDTATVAFRGQSQPVWTYTPEGGTETRIGSAGVFSNPSGQLITGASLLGVAPGFEYFQVPGAPAGTRFDQFPGSPALDGGSTVLFKGNYTVGDAGKTGVYFRDMVGGNGQSLVQLIANSETIIPGQSEGGTTVFGSTAPPSAANGTVVFVGLDNEDAPTMGGIYSAPIAPSPTLDTIVTIGSQVPGEADGITFNRFGEGLSFDGRYVSFWGAWGTGTRTRLLICGVDGNKEMLASCNEMYPNGHEVQIPVHQGIFVYDMTTKALIPITKTDSGEFSDFIYWVFSGRPPSSGGESGGSESGGVGDDVVPEPPRWRSSSFIAVAGQSGETFAVTFKAMIGPVDGIYLAQKPGASPILTVLDTYMPGQDIDPAAAPEGSSIVTVGMERDGLRGDWLVVTSSMLNADTTLSNAGVYVTPVK